MMIFQYILTGRHESGYHANERIPGAYRLRKVRYFAAICRILLDVSPLKSIKTTLSQNWQSGGQGFDPPQLHQITYLKSII